MAYKIRADEQKEERKGVEENVFIWVRLERAVVGQRTSAAIKTPLTSHFLAASLPFSA